MNVKNKKWLKIVLLLAYPFLFWGAYWLGAVFDEGAGYYISPFLFLPQKIFYTAGFSSILLIGYYFLGDYLFGLSEQGGFFKKLTKYIFRSFLLLGGVLLILWVFGPILIFPVITGISIVFIYLFKTIPSLIVYLLGSIFVLLAFIFCHHILLTKKVSYRLIIITRMITWILALCISIYCLILSSIGIYKINSSIDSVPEAISFSLWSTILLFVGIFFFLLYLLHKKVHFLLYDKKDFLLFLRSFSFDKNEHLIIQQINTIGLPVLKIGNPKRLFPTGGGDILFLPGVRWKRQVSYYIRRAKYVIMVIDASPGVLWEIQTHLNDREKIVYYTSDSEVLQRFLFAIGNSPSIKPLIECITKLMKVKNKGISFHISGNYCYYSTRINDIVSSLISGNQINIDSFLIETPFDDTDGTEPSQIMDSTKEEDVYSESFQRRMDVSRTIVYKTRQLLEKVTRYTYLSAGGILIGLLVVIATGLTVFSILLLFFPHLPLFEDSFDNEGVDTRILYVIISLLFLKLSIGLIRK